MRKSTKRKKKVKKRKRKKNVKKKRARVKKIQGLIPMIVIEIYFPVIRQVMIHKIYKWVLNQEARILKINLLLRRNLSQDAKYIQQHKKTKLSSKGVCKHLKKMQKKRMKNKNRKSLLIWKILSLKRVQKTLLRSSKDAGHSLEFYCYSLLLSFMASYFCFFLQRDFIIKAKDIICGQLSFFWHRLSII